MVKPRKGMHKCKETQFKPCNRPHNKGVKLISELNTVPGDVNDDNCIRRLPRDVFSKTIDTTHSIYRSFTHTGEKFPHKMLLRPRNDSADAVTKLQEGSSCADLSTYRLLHLGKTENMFNAAFKEHCMQSPKCDGHLTFNIENEEKRALAWIEQLKCTLCHYKSKKTKLYEEVIKPHTRGRRAATVNLGLQVGLTHNPIGNTGFSNILQCMNVPPPSLNSMQKNSNIVGEMIQTINDDDLKKRRCELKKITKFNTGVEGPVLAEADTRYNNRLCSGVGKTPFQPATQAAFTLVENSTPTKQIIGVYTANKLCKCSSGNHSNKCTANIKLTDSIGNEQEWAYRCYSNILGSAQPIKINDITTDGDSTIIKGINKAAIYNNVKLDILNSKCVRHLAEAQKRAICRTTFSKSMFPAHTCKQRTQMQNLFALDLKYRCNAEHKMAHKKYNGCIPLMIRALSYVVDAIILCYNNMCGDLCKKYSFVCSGIKNKKFQNPYFTNELCLSKSDEIQLRKIINMRLGPKAIKVTNTCRNTQKTEAVNRSYTRVNPKTTTFSRNFSSRIHSSVHFLNNGFSNSIAIKMAAIGAPISPGSKVAKSLKRTQLRDVYVKTHMKSALAKRQRALARKKKYQLYQSKPEKTEQIYKKDQNFKDLALSDHNYIKSPLL